MTATPSVSAATPTSAGAGIERVTRARLAALHRSFPGPFTAAEAAEVLSISPAESSRFLGYLSRKGWLSRVRRGMYLTVPLDAAQPGQWAEDPWVVAAKVFEPCYIGGWSAAEYWDLTDQVFRDVVVVTSRQTRGRRHVLQGMPFVVTKRTSDKLNFGVRPVWRGQTRVSVSDPTRTVVDLLDDPSIGGGIRHVASELGEYLRSEHRDEGRLVEYGDAVGNRGVFKRLGWLLELEGEDGILLERCRARRSAGLVKLDPTVRGDGRIVRRWGLRVNVALDERGDDW
ncbi:MAG: type IV toxin-antitoxin system AbiEi family antitoxin domain-containing protein [Actinomycetota bacterium]|nr:type IV toxin-antitoxin system AbiEi family antitoxin domain-containing protein [Actinomycetota bacterium]